MHLAGFNGLGKINALVIEWNGGRILTTFWDMAIYWKEIFSWTSVDLFHWWTHVLSGPDMLIYAVCDKC